MRHTRFTEALPGFNMISADKRLGVDRRHPRCQHRAMPGRSALLTLLTLAVTSGSAQAATTIGDTTTMPTAPANPGTVFIVTADGSGNSFAVPAGGGVITSVTVRGENDSSSLPPGTVRVLALRGSGSTFAVVGGGTVTLGAVSGTLQTVTAPARVPVAAGDRLGAYSPDNATVGLFGDPGAVTAASNPTGLPTDGANVTLSGATLTNGALSIAASVEPDADHDGYGDETQDSCPTIPTIHSGTCATDLQTSISATPNSVSLNDVSTVAATITNAGTQTAAGATATLNLPAGLQIVAASTTGGDCNGTTCALGDVPAGQARKVYLVVRGVAVGPQATGVTAHSTIPEANTSNDTASATITVSAPPVVATPAPAVKLCTVPSLKGQTAAAAKRALIKAGCTAGAAKGSKRKTAKVSSQSIPARVTVVAGTKVGFTMKAVQKRATRKKRSGSGATRGHASVAETARS